MRATQFVRLEDSFSETRDEHEKQYHVHARAYAVVETSPVNLCEYKFKACETEYAKNSRGEWELTDREILYVTLSGNGGAYSYKTDTTYESAYIGNPHNRRTVGCPLDSGVDKFLMNRPEDYLYSWSKGKCEQFRKDCVRHQEEQSTNG